MDALSERVGMLKNITLRINEEVREQNRQLGSMESSFGQANGLLGTTMGRLKQMAESGNTQSMCYVATVLLGLFFVCYFFLLRGKA